MAFAFWWNGHKWPWVYCVRLTKEKGSFQVK